MNSYDLENQVAGPIQTLGMSYYFDARTVDAGKGAGLNAFEFYGLGRGGVLGDVGTEQVVEAFWFFQPSVVGVLWSGAREKGEPSQVAAAYLQAAYDFADHTFGTVDPETCRRYAAAARRAIDAVPAGRYALFDGYRAAPLPDDPRHAAYLATICLRELRGGVHIEATRAEGLAPNEACYLSDETIFKLHGFRDDDVPEDPPALRDSLVRAEEETTRIMASYLDVLSNEERSAIATGVARFAERLTAR